MSTVTIKQFSQCPQAVNALRKLLFLSQLTTTSIYTENSPEKQKM